MKGDLIERDDVLKEIWEWIANREYQYTNATHWLQKRIEAIPCAEDKADRKTEPQTDCYDCVHWDYRHSVCCHQNGCKFHERTKMVERSE